MVNQTSSKDFFPDFNSAKEARSSKKDDAVMSIGRNDEADDSYEQVMQRIAEKHAAPRKEKVKIDKPKVGNKEPFFPDKPMPYHPEIAKMKPKEKEQVQAVQSDDDGNQTVLQVVPSNEKFSTEELEQIQNQLEGVDFSKLTKPSSTDASGTNQLMSQSFSKSSVTYPVKQIASQSLDNDVKQMLMDQGVWNMQGVYMAQPTPKLLNMLEMINDQKPVPVSQPVAQFMASMENELGISPDRLAQALLNLPAGQLAQPADQTMNQVIQNLNLADKKDEGLVKELYSKMLKEIQQLDQKQPVSMSQNLAAVAAMNKGQKAELLQKNLTGENLNLNHLNEHQQLQNPILAQAQNQSQNQGQSFNQQQQGQSFNQNFNPKTLADVQNSEIKKELKAEIKKMDVGPQQSARTDAMMTQHQKPQVDMLGGTTATNNLMPINNNPTAKHEAIQSIINNAQALSHKGGGEMMLTLKPDHLGEIQLKVTMNGTNVDVQMVAERSETKKLIEQNINELKHGLAQHNLSMEHLDVSVSDKNVGNFNQGRQPDFNQAREFAQQFAGHNQARQGRDEFDARQNFKPRSMLRTTSASASGLSAARRGSSSGRLNVVA